MDTKFYLFSVVASSTNHAATKYIDPNIDILQSAISVDSRGFQVLWRPCVVEENCITSIKENPAETRNKH